MSTRRVCLGALPGGAGFGLYVSLPGYDVLTDDPTDVHKFSFNSNWTNMVRTWQTGYATSTPVSFPNIGYVPHVEVRQVSLSTAYDDRPINTSGTTHQTMAQCQVTSSSLVWSNPIGPASIFYVIFEEPVS